MGKGGEVEVGRPGLGPETRGVGSGAGNDQCQWPGGTESIRGLKYSGVRCLDFILSTVVSMWGEKR